MAPFIKALIAEFIGGELAKALGLHIPEIIFATLSEAFGRTEPDEEIQDLLKASTGLNLGLHYHALSCPPKFYDIHKPIFGFCYGRQGATFSKRCYVAGYLFRSRHDGTAKIRLKMKALKITLCSI